MWAATFYNEVYPAMVTNSSEQMKAYVSNDLGMEF